MIKHTDDKKCKYMSHTAEIHYQEFAGMLNINVDIKTYGASKEEATTNLHIALNLTKKALKECGE